MRKFTKSFRSIQNKFVLLHTKNAFFSFFLIMATQNNSENLKERTARGLFWSVFGNGAQQLVTMLIGVILARILDVEDYGLVAMLTVYSIIAGNLQESGFTSALAIRHDATDRDFNAVFWFSVITSGIIYTTLFLCAPLIAHFNHAPQLVSLGRVIFLGFFFSSLGTAQAAWLFRNLMVREKTSSQVMASLLSGIVGLACAFAGMGVWALVAMDLTYKITYTAMVWYWSPWRPTLSIDLHPAWEMLGFGSKLLLTNILNTLNSQLLQSILGHFYSPTNVGHYSQANKWNTLGHSLLGGMINSVAQPVLAKVEDDKDRQLRVFRKMLRFTSMIAFPAMFGLALVADFVPLLIGGKWDFCVPYLRVLALGAAFIPVNNVFSNLLVSRTRSDLFLFTTAAFLVLQLGLVALLVTRQSLIVLLVAMAALQPLWLFVLWSVARSLLRVRLTMVLADVLPFFLVAAASIGAGYCAGMLSENAYVSILLRILTTTIAYCATMWSAKVVVFRECVEFLWKKFQ